MTKRQHFSISLLYLWTSPLQTILMIRAGTLRSREDERVKKGEEGYGEVRALPTVLKANGECQVKLEEESDDSIWEGLQQGKGGVKIWLLVQTERSLSETFNKMQNFRRVGFHSLLYVNLETPRKAPHQLLAAAEDHTTIWEIHRLRTRQSFFMC